VRAEGRKTRRIVFAASALAGARISLAGFAGGISTGNVQNASVTEASGIAASRFNPNVLWIHNDSGDSARVFATTPAGTNLGTYSLSGASATDWEDIAVGPGPTNGVQYLYVADIGDNAATRSNVSVYRVVEPTVSDTQSPVTTSISGASKFTFTYPDGARDAESMFVDPLTRDIYIISKRDTTKYVYRAPYPQSTSGTTTLTFVTSMVNATWITGADISPNGNEIIMRGAPSNTGLLYTRPTGGTIADAFATTPVSIPLASEPQGEAIAFDPSGWGYFTTSEGANQPIYYFNRQPPPAGAMYWDNDAAVAGTYQTSGAGMGGTGTWNTTLRWYNGSAEVAWVNGNDAIFWGTAGTVTLSSTKTVNSLSFKTNGYVLTGSTISLAGSTINVDTNVSATIASLVTGSAGLMKTGSGNLSLTNTNNYSGATTVSAGTLTLTKNLLTSSSIAVSAAAKLELSAGTATVIKTQSVSGSGRIDLQDNDMIITNMSRAAVEALVKSGFGTFNWQGTGITSSAAATFAQTNGSRALGVIDNANWGYQNFSGQSVSQADILIKFTYVADANLDGLVDNDDFGQFLFGFSGAGPARWLNGDFDYSGAVDNDDFGWFLTGLAAFNASGNTQLSDDLRTNLTAFASANGLPLVLPEPSVAALVPLTILLRRRRRGGFVSHNPTLIAKRGF
jgi:autotransporter-associated beta strand protein